jgi:chromosome segregation and condensation protein ScpB
LSIAEASVVLDASVAGVQAAAAELGERLGRVGMAVVEDDETIAMVPHRAYAGLLERATTAAEVMPKLTGAHLGVLGIVIHAGAATRRRIDELRASIPRRPSPSSWNGDSCAVKGPTVARRYTGALRGCSR